MNTLPDKEWNDLLAALSEWVRKLSPQQMRDFNKCSEELQAVRKKYPVVYGYALALSTGPTADKEGDK